MADNIQKTKGRSSSYKFDRGGVPAEFGPYIGIVKNNVDTTRSGRLQVYIEQFGGKDPNDKSLWRTVSYVPPFYGVTPKNAATTTSGTGNFKGNQQSYGMWFTPPDIGVSVICFFVAGDPDQGYYLGCVPDPGVNHMIPAIGASRKFATPTSTQQTEINSADAKQLPVVEINNANKTLYENPRFFDQPKPIHNYIYSVLLNQGLLGDYIRGPISSSSQRESPSAVFGFSTPGRPIYQGGLTEKDIKSKLDSGTISLSDVKIEGRRGGHSIVLDDGNLQGQDNLIRIRTSKGHQITMSDEADCFYFIHANGQTWIELGTEGTVDVYSTNSVNVRTQGTINLHADKDININAGQNLNIRAGNLQVESQGTTKISSAGEMTVYSKAKIGCLSDGTIVLQSDSGGWKTSNNLTFKANRIDLNGGAAPESVEAPKPIAEHKLDDTVLVAGQGWKAESGKLVTVVTRAPTHEPYPYHNRGVPVEVSLSGTTTTPPKASVAAALASTVNVPVTNAVTSSSVLTTPVADINVGSLDRAQVTGLLAQTKTAVNQAPTDFSVDKGIGTYGLKPIQLEAAGFLKPGTLSAALTAAGTPTAADVAESTRINKEGGNTTPELVVQARKTNQMLTSPTVWTGLAGVTGLTNLLNNNNLQNATQQTLMSKTLNGLKTSGIVNGKEKPQDLAPLVQSATAFGVTAVDQFIKGTAPPGVKTNIQSTIKSAQYSTNFVNEKLGSFTGFATSVTAAANTVDRTGIDLAVKTALGDSKIPIPEFKPAERPEDNTSSTLSSMDKLQMAVNNYGVLIESTIEQLNLLYAEATRLDSSLTITKAQASAIDQKFQSVTQNYNSKNNSLSSAVNNAYSLVPADATPEADALILTITRSISLLQGLTTSTRELIAGLIRRAV